MADKITLGAKLADEGYVGSANPMPVTDAGLAIALGQVEGHAGLNKFGRNAVIDTATDPEDVWDGGGLWVPPTQARVHAIVSTDEDDDPAAGAGAHAVAVLGAGDEYQLQGETVAMDGLTPVNTTKSYTSVFRMLLSAAGSSLTNTGVITATAATDATVTAQINAAKGQTFMAIYTVPAGKSLVLHDVRATINKATGSTTGQAILTLRSRGPIDVATSPWRERHSWGITMNGGQPPPMFDPPKVFTEKTHLVVRVESVTTNGTDISCWFNGVLVDD